METSPLSRKPRATLLMPAGVGFTIQIDSEQMVVTSKSTNTLTVTRGANGTTAATHSSGANVNLAFDQRGAGFPRQADGNGDSTAVVDVGAFETAPEINVTGNGVSISDGDTTPDTADHTDFGSTSETGGTVTRTFTIENSGTADLAITGVTMSGADPGDFTVTTGPASPVTPANSTTFEVTFDPSATGTRSAVVNVANND